jgi:hypothetical protein
MHRRFAAWLSQPPRRGSLPWRTALTTAAFGALAPFGLSPLSVAAGAIPVLLILRQQSSNAIMVLIAGVAAQATVFISARQPLSLTALYVGLVYLVPAALAVLLVRYGALNFCFQLAVLASVLGLVIVYVALPDPTAVWKPAAEELLQSFRDSGMQIDPQVVSGWVERIWGPVTALWMVTALCALFLGRWWHSLLEAPGAFGREYQQLRLGTVLGIAGAAVLVCALAFRWPMIDDMAWVVMTALSMQGLAAAHRRKSQGGITRGLLAGIYVLLIIPFSAFVMVPVLAGWGFADNWRKARAAH